MDSAERIKRIRKQAGLSQRALGLKFGIPARTIQNWEYGVSEAPEYLLDLIEEKINRKEPELHLTLHYKNGTTIEQGVNYLHFEGDGIFFTVKSGMHPIFQEPVKVPVENLESWDAAIR